MEAPADDGEPPQPLALPRTAVVAGCAVGFGAAWNIANLGAVADPLAHAYGVGLAVVGLFTTALSVVHAGVQVPAGRAIDRLGAKRLGLAALGVLVLANALAMLAPSVWLAIPLRALAGVGSGFGFVAGSDYVRATSGSPVAQGVFGGVTMVAAGGAVAVVPQVAAWVDWRAPFLTAVIVAAAAAAILAAAPREPRGPAHEGLKAGILRDTRLYRFAAVHAASFGLSVLLGNWIVPLLVRHGGYGTRTAGLVGALTLSLGIVTRPLGGWILRRPGGRARAAVAWSIAAGAAATLVLALVSTPLVVAVALCAVIGLAAGIPFAPAFAGAARVRPDAPAAAVGFVNGAANAVILAGTPLVGLTFALPGRGRIGFVAVAVLWGASLLALPRRDELGA